MHVVRSQRVVLPDGIRPAALWVRDGAIAEVAAYDASVGDATVTDAGLLTVSPGIVDTHVHVNEPGRTEWEGFDTATRAAAAGGITMLVDMPLNSVPATTTVDAFLIKQQAAEGRLHVDVGFWGGVVPGNARELLPLLRAGVRGFKCFLTPSGVDEFASVDEADLRVALGVVSRGGGTGLPFLLLVHAEDPSFLRPPHGDVRHYATYRATRPPAAEVSAINLVGRLSLEFDVRAHIVHVSSADGVAAIADLQRAGVALTAETCPHYLVFSDDEIADGATEFKCAPPIRDARHRDALWNGLKDGVLTMVVTDHSPSPPSMKRRESGDFCSAWGGIASLQVALPAVWTEARRRGFTERDLARWMSEAPAALCALDATKGRLTPGADADFVVWDPAEEFIVHGAHLQHRHPLTPYEGRRLVGVVHATYVRGTCVWRDGALQRVGSGRFQ